MPVFRYRIKPGLTVVAGVTRSRVPDLDQIRAQARKLRRARKRVRQQQRQIERLQHSTPAPPGSGGIMPENIIWIDTAGEFSGADAQ